MGGGALTHPPTHPNRPSSPSPRHPRRPLSPSCHDSRLTAPMSLLLLLMPLAALLLQGAAAQLTTVPTFPVDWAEVPADPPTTRNLTANCNCDLREDGCDLGCCCDSTCPEGLNTLFTDTGVCLPQGFKQQQLTYCVPKNYVFKVNLPSSSDFYSITKDQAEVKFFSQLLCIVDDSNPNLGATYPDPPAGPVGDNQNLAQCPAAESPPAKSTDYRFRSYVYVQQPAGALINTTIAVTQPLRVPFPAFSNECSDEFVVGFLVNLPSGSREYYSPCQRDLTALNLTNECSGSGLLTPQYYSGLRFLTGRGSSVLPQAVTTVTTQYLDPVTGNLTAVNATTSAYNATSGLCTNVVRYLNITMYYSVTDTLASDTPGYIDSMEVTFVVTDVLVSATPLQQGVRVSWMPTSIPQPIEVIVSGNPGYITGFPMLAGTLASFSDGLITKQAIGRLVGGLPVAAPGPAGACSPTSLEFVKYNVNASSTCSVSLNAAELRDFCTTEQNRPEKYVAQVLSSLYQSIIDNKLYVGEWGDADYNNIEQWLQVKVSGFPFNPSIYSTSDNACSGVITGFDLQVVTGVAFSSNNLQQKVLYVNLCFKTGVWDFPEYLSAATSRRFFLDFTANFVRLPQQSEEVKKPAPPLVVPLPADIFYPFVATTGSAAGARPELWGAMLAAAVAVALLQGRQGRA